MKFKTLIAGVTAFTCCAVMASYMPYSNIEVNAAELVNNDFEVNYDGWCGSDYSVNLIAENGKGYDGSRGMTVSGRTSDKDGASSSKGLYLEGEVEYTYSVQVYSENAENFHLMLTCVDIETEKETTVELASEKVKSGKWTELSADYTAPENSGEFRLTILTDSTNDFSFDNVTVTSKEQKNTVYAASTEKGLKDEFADYFRVGNILNGTTVKNSTITANIIKDYNSIECENETKPDATMVQSQCSGTNIGVSLNNAASIIDFCINNNISMRGHTLVWHSQTPEWFFKENFNASGNWVSEAVMDQRMESYIKNLFSAIETQYPELNLYAYDVANECVSDDSNRTANYGGAREPGYNNGLSPWVQIYGDNDFVEKAFTYARKYAPEGCDLYYNDYNEYWDHKRDCIYNMCKSLYEKGLLDGVGMQSHVPANATGFAGTDSYITAMQKYLSIGCDVQVTELDISVDNGKYTSQEQADKYKAIFQAAMDWNKSPQSDGRVTAVCIWGPNDANSWLSSGSNALLYDSNNQPKTAYTTLTSMIPQSEWGDGSNYNQNIEPNEYGWYFHSPFEGDVDSWQARGSSSVLTSGRTAYAGSESLLVMDRAAAWNGAYRALNSKAFVPGNEYSFSANVMYYDGDSSEKFYLKLQYTDAEGNTQYSEVAQATAVKGEWVQLANKNYLIPSDASNMQLYVETAESTNNFYIDEAIGAVGGTTILGAGESKEIILGDINFDGSVNSLDVAVARKGCINGFTDTYEKISADVDQSGVFDETDLLLIHDFVLGKITEFPVAEKIIDTEAMENLFSQVTVASSYKTLSNGNPCITQRFTADPGVMEYNGRVYVYTTNDAFEYDASGNLQENSYAVTTINCMSSDDMVNWTDHGAIPVAGSSGAAKWASRSWAPCAAHKTINGKEKFFLYFADNASGIGVLTSDSPTGPWTDPIGKQLISRSTANCGYGQVEWLFDPAVLVDSDGTSYLYFGGGVPEGAQANPKTARAVKLGDDMISLAGTPQEIDAPYLFEDSGINKIGNTYYYSYCTNWNTGGNNLGITNAVIAYMTSSSPLGPFTYSGTFFNNPGSFGTDFGGGGNNHHSIVELNGKYYLFYHARAVEQKMGINLNYRSTQVNELTVSNGKLQAVTGTMNGISQLNQLNPYKKIQAETIYRQAGINVRNLGDTIVTDIQKGDWIGVSGANFSNGASKITVNVSSANGGAIKVCTGSENGTTVGYIDVPANSSFTEVTAPVSGLSGNNDVYLIFSDSMEIDYWYFT